MTLDLTESERTSLAKILSGVYLRDYGSRIVADAQAILSRLVCITCRRRPSASAGCPERCGK